MTRCRWCGESITYDSGTKFAWGWRSSDDNRHCRSRSVATVEESASGLRYANHQPLLPDLGNPEDVLWWLNA